MSRRNGMVSAIVAMAFIASAHAADSYSVDRPPAAQHIFRCQMNGQSIFSDRPCAASGQSAEVVLTPVNSYHEDALPSHASHKSSTKASRREPSARQPASIAAEQLRVKQRCQRIADQLDTIHSKMNSGYTAQQGERLRERQRQLEQQRRTEFCR